MRTSAALLLALPVLLLTACGDDSAAGAGRDDPAAPAPSTAPPPVGEVTTQRVATVLDDGGGAELCLGGVAESYPPQCSGLRLVGWDWAEHEGHFEEANGVRWGDFVVQGRFDGRAVTPTRVLPAARAEPPPLDDVDLTTPCPEPPGGWTVLDPATTTPASMDATMQAAIRLDGYAGAWLDQSVNPAHGSDEPGAADRLNDPTLLVVNVRVTGDPAAAEAELRKTWGGALCVSRAEHTEAELRAVQQELDDLPGLLSSGLSDQGVELSVVYDDGSLQQQLDERYGAGVVRVDPALAPVEG